MTNTNKTAGDVLAPYVEVPPNDKAYHLSKDEELNQRIYLYETLPDPLKPTLTDKEKDWMHRSLWLADRNTSYIGYHDGSCSDTDGSILRRAFAILNKEGFTGYMLSSVYVFIPKNSPKQVMDMLKNAGYALWATDTPLYKRMLDFR